jgi:tRNA G18 (ribose-2'-O)-methylase SpoU
MIVVLDNLRSAYNVGSILRTCDALGIKEVYFCGITPDDRDPKVQKTALGAADNINKTYKSDTYSSIKSLKNNGYKVIGLEINKNSLEVSKAQHFNKMALIVGNEVCGLSDETIEQCDVLIQIPMKGIKESLNVSVAFGIAAYELTKP